MPSLPEPYIKRMLSMPLSEGVVIGAFLPSGALVGWIDLVETAPGVGDIGVLVADPWQGMGIGKRLVAEGAKVARERSVALLTADVLHSNERAKKILSAWEGASWRYSAGLVNYALPVERAPLPVSTVQFSEE
ncbi:GNAT family N-acetyltransferase [Streptomyces werraensis]|uniref:GNAT family N-acetyltransferase n=1 Tax=Streptomyces werraensis TaxID=68284 RepID=UPI001CE3A0A5